MTPPNSTGIKLWRGNINIPSPKSKEKVSKEEYTRRVTEIIRCKKDILYFAEKYFWIINLDQGKQIIKLYEKQKELLSAITKHNRVVLLSSRQVGKTTIYTIFCLWLTMFHPEKKIMIVANRRPIAIEILDRIRFAYELLPLWLKPAVDIYNRGSIVFTNKSGVEAESTSSNSARGKSCNVLVVDEAARIPPNILSDFWTSTYPIVSSGKNSKVIMVSTASGVAGLFYDTYTTARDLDGHIKPEDWVRVRIDWWDVPGRDAAWKRLQLESMSEEEFAQEYGNSFLSSKTPALIPPAVIETFRQTLEFAPKYEEVGITYEGADFTIKVWCPPRIDRTYIIGADVGEGLGKNKSTILVFDVTNTKEIILCASFSNNMIKELEMTYVLYTVACMYNKPFIAIECNGITKAVTTRLIDQPYYYEHFVTFSDKPGERGIRSNGFIKNKACLWLHTMVTNAQRKFYIFDRELIDDEMSFFVRSGKCKSFSALTGRDDDLMMTWIWAMMPLHKDFYLDYFTAVSEENLTDGTKQPILLQQENNPNEINTDVEIFSFRKPEELVAEVVSDDPTDNLPFESDEEVATTEIIKEITQRIERQDTTQVVAAKVKEKIKKKHEFFNENWERHTDMFGKSITSIDETENASSGIFGFVDGGSLNEEFVDFGGY